MAGSTRNQRRAPLASGTTVDGIFAMVERIRRVSDIPILCYTYLNPIHAHGAEGVLRAAATAGVDGMLILDLPVEESASYVQWMRESNLNHIALVTPTTPPASHASWRVLPGLCTASRGKG